MSLTKVPGDQLLPTKYHLAQAGRPRILLNTTTLIKGGALQISLHFIKQVLQEPGEFHWSLALSKRLAEELHTAGIELPEDSQVFPVSPARDNDSRRRLRALANRWNPDGVFSFCGPAYINFKQPHLMGCMAGWVTHAGATAYRTLNWREKAVTLVETLYKIWWFRQADLWYTETEQARRGMISRFRVPAENVHVISNSCGENFFACEAEQRPWPDPQQKLRIFCFSAAYKHKYLILLPRIADELRRRDPARRFEIVLTLPDTDWAPIEQLARQLGVESHFVNRGVIPVMQAPALFTECDLLLLPTVLETFSATYPEAMAMGLPIVTTDLDFAHEICRDAAVFYSPFDAGDAAEKIIQLYRDPELWQRLVVNGKQRLRDFPRPKQRKDMYLELCRKLVTMKAKS